MLRDRLSNLFDAAFLLSLGETVVRVAFTVALALVVLGVVKRVKRRWVERARRAGTTDPHHARVLTLSDLLGSVARYAVWSVAAVMILSDVGFEVGPLLASAGVAGLAIGFGAQTLVKDVISGFFLLFDNTISSGDLITFSGKEATVEYIGLRLIKARTFDGEVLMIPAGEMRVFGNKSLGFARAVVDVSLSYGQDLGEALRVLEDVARAWSETDAARAVMLENAAGVQGILHLGESSVEARVAVKVRPGAQAGVERDLRARVAARFDAHGVPVPQPSATAGAPSDGAPDAA